MIGENLTRLSSVNRDKYLQIVRTIKPQFPHGAVAEIARKYPDIPERHFYRVLQRRRIDPSLLEILRKELPIYIAQQELIAQQLGY